jgi:DNA primase
LYIPSCAPNNEGAFLPPQLPYKFSQRFKRIVTWFDNDYAGHKAAKKYQQLYGYEPIFIPRRFAKDPFEYVSKYGHIEFVKLSNYLLYEK